MTGTELLSRAPAEQLADLIRQAQDWAEVETAIASFPEQKAQAWQMLDDAEGHETFKPKKQHDKRASYHVGLNTRN